MAAATETYKLVRHETMLDTIRPGQWNPYKVTEISWWVEGPHVERPATVEEIDIVRDTLARVLAVVAKFDEFVNIGSIGSTPTEAIKLEFGI